MFCLEDEWFLDLKEGPYLPAAYLIHFFPDFQLDFISLSLTLGAVR